MPAYKYDTKQTSEGKKHACACTPMYTLQAVHKSHKELEKAQAEASRQRDAYMKKLKELQV